MYKYLLPILINRVKDPILNKLNNSTTTKKYVKEPYIQNPKYLGLNEYLELFESLPRILNSNQTLERIISNKKNEFNIKSFVLQLKS